MMTNSILTVLAGSHAHGIDTAASDFDYLKIVMAPLKVTLGLAPAFKTQVERTAPEGVRASAGDVETTTYELRHFMQLAAQGNPNILVPLYASEEHVIAQTDVGRQLRKLAPHIVSKQALRRHLGYLDAQRGRMIGNGPHQARKPNRPELIEMYGYDVKYAAHALRLAWQGIELAQTGSLTLPMLSWVREGLRSLREGHWSEDEALEGIEVARDILVAYVEGRLPVSPELRDEPDWRVINNFLVLAQLGFAEQLTNVLQT